MADRPKLRAEPLAKHRSALRHHARWLRIGAALCLACCSGKDVLVGFNHGSTALPGSAGASSPAASTLGGAAVGGTLVTGTVLGNAAFGGVSFAGATSSSSVDACANGGPVIALPTIGSCTNDLARRFFLFAICTCSDFVANGGVTTDPFGGPAEGYDLGASIGVNGSYLTDDEASYLKGSLWVLGDAEFGNHDIQGDLQCAQSVTVTSKSTVHRNAYINGDVMAPHLAIDGTLSISEGSWGVVESVQGSTQSLSQVSVPTPCACENPIDIASIVDHFKNDNDNAQLSLSPSQFAATKDDTRKTLPCGRFYFDSFGGTGSVTLRITGRTLIAVGGSMSNSGGLVVDLSSSAELDLFVSGSLELSGPIAIGNENRPAATRVYVGGQAAFSSNLSLFANWYIPNSVLAMSAPSELWGAVFSGSLQSSAGLTVHYDQSVLDLPSCSPISQSCGGCHDCANPTPACHSGKCEACQVDSDCCPPLYCNHGACQVTPVLL